MLTTVFCITGDDKEKQLAKVQANVRLLRSVDPGRHVSLLIEGTPARELGVEVAIFDRVYEADACDNRALFLAKTLYKVEGDHVLYLDNDIFTLDPLYPSLPRLLPNGVYFPQRILDFRGNPIDIKETWQRYVSLSKHTWPVIPSRCVFFGKDDRSKNFFLSLIQFAENWKEVSAEISDGAMAELTWDHLISFTCMCHDDLYDTSSALDYRSLAQRDHARDKNWVNKEWYDWLDVWWTTKDLFCIRIENFRQQGMIELSGSCAEKVEEWLAKRKQ